MRAREPALFWPRFRETSYQMLKILSFCDREEGVTSFNKNNRVNFYFYFLRIREKTLSQMSSSYLKISILAPPICRLFLISWDCFLFPDRLSTRHRHFENESMYMHAFCISRVLPRSLTLRSNLFIPAFLPQPSYR